uniref:Uncharacterized protein n=2 Tax=Anopheles minimus TaxID=112268 RepID=A0A182WNS8_9DIPT
KCFFLSLLFSSPAASDAKNIKRCIILLTALLILYVYFRDDDMMTFSIRIEHGKDSNCCSTNRHLLCSSPNSGTRFAEPNLDR